MMVERIVALDPGGTTGWAMWQDEQIKFDGGPWGHFTGGHIEGADHHKGLYDFLCTQQTQVFTVVCERFMFRIMDNKRDKVVLDSAEYEGVVKFFHQERMMPLGQKLFLQTPALAKGFIPDKAVNGMPANHKLKIIGLYTPGKVHMNDAMRHLITYMVQKRGRTDLVSKWRDL